MDSFFILPWMVLGTSFISGVVGMGGGLVLMAFLGLIMDVPEAMVLHGVVQLSSNGTRAVLYRQNIQQKVLLRYFIGALIAGACFLAVGRLPSMGTVYLVLGMLPFLSFLPTQYFRPDISKGFNSFWCGLWVSGAHLLAGVSGPLLDIFFLNGRLGRFEVLGTKAITQCLGHATKLLLYGAIGGQIWLQGGRFWWLPACAALAPIGNIAGKRLVQRLSEGQFRNAGRVVVSVTGALCIYRGLSLLLA